MRPIAKLAAIVALVGVAAGAYAPGAPTDELIIGICGGGLERVFAEFGAPKRLVAKRDPNSSKDDDVLFDYGHFILRVHEDTVTHCFITSDWKNPIHGIKIGASREEVTQALGKPNAVIKDKEGVETAYRFRISGKAVMWTNFDEAGKVKRVEISLPD